MAVIVVSGALANKPGNGGAAWTRLSWPLGFKQLGHDVYFIEQIATDRCRDASDEPCAPERSVNVSYFRSVTERLGFDGRAWLIAENDGRCLHGADDLDDIAGAADLLVNIGGHLTYEPLKSRFRKRLFIDQDPGYTQFWQLAGLTRDRLRGHDFFFTVGENIGARDCPIPTCGIDWHPLRQPIVLNEWPAAPTSGATRFTTVGSWRGAYGRVVHEGVLYGLKVHEFRKFVSLPRYCDQPFEIALSIDAADHADVDALEQNGWQLADPRTVAGDPFAFRAYVQASAAEFSVAQGIYVETRSGWFSDRTVRYLASGKPALVQDTGFSRTYPIGCGLVPFTTLDDAIRGADAIARDYEMQARAARTIAEEFFDSDKVVGSLLEIVM